MTDFSILKYGYVEWNAALHWNTADLPTLPCAPLASHGGLPASPICRSMISSSHVIGGQVWASEMSGCLYCRSVVFSASTALLSAQKVVFACSTHAGAGKGNQAGL